ncbi:MAG: hypothetical protein GY771_00780, partial [bacterium]|nr:hypothetical protein [bacterium]
LGQAAKETGKAKATISKAIKSGKLSAIKNDRGGYDIDPAELFRVYPANSNKTVDEPPKSERQETPSELVELRAKVNSLQEQSKQAQETVEDLRRRLDESERERRQKDGALTALLTDQRDRSSEVDRLKVELEAEKGRGWWSRLLGR